ncbi:MAG: hypothetical protein ACRYGF_09030 [Janthinobacterium lividum]
MLKMKRLILFVPVLSLGILSADVPASAQFRATESQGWLGSPVRPRPNLLSTDGIIAFVLSLFN